MLVERSIMDSHPALEAFPTAEAVLRMVDLLIDLGSDIVPSEAHFEQ